MTYTYSTKSFVVTLTLIKGRQCWQEMRSKDGTFLLRERVRLSDNFNLKAFKPSTAGASNHV